MNIESSSLEGVYIIDPKVHGDSRGFFKETYQKNAFLEAGLDLHFLQDNVSKSSRGVLRGLHFQNPHGQGKLVQIFSGEVFDVVVDLRPSSPTFGKSETFVLSEENHRQLYISPGFAHGFLTLSETATFFYKCTDLYHPECEHTLLWSDPALAIEWPIMEYEISEKDKKGKLLSDFGQTELEGPT